MKKIYLTLGGGLGNQMFQYAAARAYQIQYGGEICLCSWHYIDKIEMNRTFSLAQFYLNRCVKKASILEENMVKQEVRRYQGSKLLFFVRHMPSVIQNIFFKYTMRIGFLEPIGSYRYVKFVDYRTENIYMRGAFQNIKYFLDVADLVRKEFTFKNSMKPNNLIIANKIRQTESVCVHIRRGDFLNKEFQHLNICDREYYEKGVLYLKQKKPNAKFFVFSNTHEDIEWIKQNYIFPDGTIYVDENNEDFEELQLMAECKNFIISNSTFSWWAQFLSNYKDKIVVAPSVWDKNAVKESQGLYMSSWHIIKVSAP